MTNDFYEVFITERKNNREVRRNIRALALVFGSRYMENRIFLIAFYFGDFQICSKVVKTVEFQSALHPASPMLS